MRAQCAATMESPPAAALIMAEADFLLEVAVIALDTPAHLGEIDEPAQRHVRVDGCEPVFGRLGLALGPLDEQRLFGETCFAPIGEMRTRTWAKRDRSFLLVPSRHAAVRQVRLGRLRANASTLSCGAFVISWLKRLETRSSRANNSPQKATRSPTDGGTGTEPSVTRMALSLKTANALGLDAPRARRKRDRLRRQETDFGSI